MDELLANAFALMGLNEAQLLPLHMRIILTTDYYKTGKLNRDEYITALNRLYEEAK